MLVKSKSPTRAAPRPDAPAAKQADLFVTRRPIFNARKDVYGYELVFRAGFDRYYATWDALSVVGADEATEDAISFVRFAELTNGKVGFVHFTRKLLTREVPSLLPSEMVVVGIPEDIQPDAEVIATCRKLRELGYTLAMEDLFVLQHRYSGITRYADIIRVDFARATPEERESICQEFNNQQVLMLAGNLETAEEFDEAAAKGYSLFEGEFFAKPLSHPGKEIAGTKLAYLQVLREVHRSEMSYDELEVQIKQDVSMTYKLLRFMNSAWFGLRYEVSSIKHALVLLGPKEIRKWFSLLVIRHAAMDKPNELILRALFRARMAEQLGAAVGLAGMESELFLMGMFSLIDALTDTPIMDVLDGLPISETVKAALLGEEGSFHSVYEMILSYEKGNWTWFAASAEKLGLDERIVPDLFKKSMRWADDALREM